MIESFKISNYKNLDGFEFNGFGRINLITGKNNVGKTNLLEAIFLALKRDIKFLAYILYTRGNKFHTSGHIELNRNFNESLFSNLNLNQSISLSINNKKFNFELKDLEKLSAWFKDIANIEYIPSNEILNGTTLSKYFTTIIRIGKKNTLIKCLNIIDNEIEDIQILVDDNKANIYLTKKNISLPISFFGDAIQILFNTFSRIILSENKTIFIDEIENGIYYENQKEFWSNLLEISKVTNCQVIATTHSLEMINAFYEATKDEDDCKLLKMVKNIDNEIVLREMEKDLIEYILEDKHLNESNVLR